MWKITIYGTLHYSSVITLLQIWLDGNTPTEEMWLAIMKQEEQHNYSATQTNEGPPAVQHEINIFTSSSEGSMRQDDSNDIDDGNESESTTD